MKRLFPRAVPEALIALLFLGGACSPSSNPKPGAPVLGSLSIVDPSSGMHLADVTPDTVNCASGAKEGDDCDPATAVCELDANVVCLCKAKDMCDPSIKPDAAVTGGTLNCTFPPTSVALAVFDRLLSTAPFDANTSVAMLSAIPTSTAMASTDYTSSGATQGLVFPAFFGIPAGPSVAMSGTPAAPVDSTVTYTLDPNSVKAKDGKTSFVGMGLLLADGKIAFKTSSFTASIQVPAPPPPMDMGGGSMMPMGCPGQMPDMDAGSDGGANTDGGADDAAAAEGGANVDAAVAEVGATVDAGTDAGDDGGTMTPPSTDVPADMNTGAVTITFSNRVDATILGHIKFTENGQAFTDLMGPDAMKDFGTPLPTSLTFKPATMWKAGMTYEVTVDAMAKDALGAPLGMNAPPPASFTMAK
jgi:hypothetical protein